MSERPKSVATSSLLIANLNTFNPKTSLHFADTYVFRDKNTGKAYGELFVVLQIDHASRTSPQVGDAVATVLQHEFYRGNPSETAKNFEDALHKTNEILSDLAARGEIHWIGKLHGVACVVKGSDVHVSATGRGKAFLVREDELAEISSGLYDSSRAASPLKTFEHQASGDLKDGDILLLATPGIPEQLTLQSLRQILQKKNPRETTDEMMTQLGRDSSTANSAVILHYDSKHQHEIAVETPGAVTASAGKKDVAAKVGAVPASGSPAAEFTSKKPKGRLSKLTSRLKMRRGGRGSAKDPKRSNVEAVPAATTASASPDQGITESAPSSRGRRFSLSLKTVFKRVPRKVKVFGGLALMAIFVFVVSLFVFSDSQKLQAEREVIFAKFADAKNLEEQASAAIIFSDLTQALQLLQQSETTLNEIPEDPSLSEDITALRSAIAQDYEKLNGAVNIDDPEVLASFLGEQPLGLTLANGLLLAWSDNGEILSAEIEGGAKTEQTKIDNDLGDPLLGVVDDQADLILLTDESQLVSFSGNKITELDVSGTFKPENPVGLATYGNRLYLLDAGANKLYRHQQTVAGYTQGEGWIVDGTDVSQAVDFAIDGNIWFLLADGSVIQMLQGSKEEYSLGELLDPLENPTRLITEEDMEFLYILEPGKQRLLQFEKESGEFVKQYKSDKFDQLKDMVIVEEGQRAFLLNDNTIFQINLQS